MINKRINNNYTYEFKKDICEKYLSGKYGEGKTLCQKSGIRSRTQLFKWLKLYRKDPELIKDDGRGKGTSLPKDESSLLQIVDKAIYWYNNERPQRKLKGMTPIQYRESHLSRVLF